MAIAPVLKTGVRKDIRVRIPGPPFYRNPTAWLTQSRRRSLLRLRSRTSFHAGPAVHAGKS